MNSVSQPSESLSAVKGGWQNEAPTFRHNAAAFWLNLLFWSVNRYPILARLTRPLFLTSAWMFSSQLRGRTLDNAKWLLGPDSSMAQRRRLAKRVIQNFYSFIIDVGRAKEKTLEQLVSNIGRVEGQEHHERARAGGRGLIVATAHLGSFEVGIASMRNIEPRVHVVFQRDRYSRFDGVRHDLHVQLDIKEAIVDDGWDIWLRLRDVLLAGEVVLIQADRVMPGQKGLKVPFCGGHVILPLGPVKLAALTGCPILPVFAIRQPDKKICIHIEPAIEVGKSRDDFQTALNTLSAVIEKQVLAHPDQWLMIHRMWCEDIDANEPVEKVED